MFRTSDPQTSLLATSHFLPKDKRERLENDWPGQFARRALPLIDEDAFRDLYHESNGRPNKPVRIVIGALLLKEMHDLTDHETVGALDFDLRWHVALDLEPTKAHLCQKTLHNFRAKLMRSDKARLLFEDMTGKIIEALGIDTDRQRLDSTPAGPEGSAERTARAHHVERGAAHAAGTVLRNGARVPEGSAPEVEEEVRRGPGRAASEISQG